MGLKKKEAHQLKDMLKECMRKRNKMDLKYQSGDMSLGDYKLFSDNMSDSLLEILEFVLHKGFSYDLYDKYKSVLTNLKVEIKTLGDIERHKIIFQYLSKETEGMFTSLKNGLLLKFKRMGV